MALVVLASIFLILTIRGSFFASEGPDEVAHFYFNRFVAHHGRLPLTNEERLEAGYKADLPPLFYLMTGLTAQGIDLESGPQIKTTRSNPRLQLVAGLENIKAWRLIKTEDPLRGEILLWYWGRWFTILTGLACLTATFLLLRKLFPDYPWLAVGGVALLGFLPSYIYISGITSYEPLAGLLMTLYFLFLFDTVRHPAQNWNYLGLGLLLGLAALTRHTPWPVLPVVPLLAVWLAIRQGWTWQSTLKRIGLFAGGVLVTFGSWVLYISLYFNRIDELGWMQGTLSPLLIGDGSGKTSQQIASVMTGGQMGISDFSRQSDSLWQWLSISFSGVWGTGWLGGVMLIIYGVAIIGLVRRWLRETESMRLWLSLLIIHIPLLMAFPFLRFVFSGNARTMMSQHILFTAGAVMVVLLIYGLLAWPRLSKYVTGLLLVLAGGYLMHSAPQAFNQANFIFSVQTVAAEDEQTLATFDTISLLGYEIEVDAQQLQVSLQWRAEANSPEDYRWAVSLLDNEEQLRRRWIGQPLNGLYPTRAWLPGDRVRDTISLPVVDLPSGDYDLQIQVLSEFDTIETTQQPPVVLTSVNLDPASLTSTETVQLDDQTIGYTLWEASDEGRPVYYENSVVSISSTVQDDTIRFKLVDPTGQAYEPFDRVETHHLFLIEPMFASGDYHLRVEQWQADELIAQTETMPLLRVETEPRQFTPGPITQPLEANFAGYITLLGYDLPESQVQPGTPLPVTLHWQARRTIGADLVMFSRLLDAEQTVRGGRDRLVREVYSTMLWAPNEVVADPFVVQVDADAPEGVYTLVIGLYLPVGEAAVSLPLMQDNQMTEITSVTIGPITVGEMPPKP